MARSAAALCVALLFIGVGLIFAGQALSGSHYTFMLVWETGVSPPAKLSPAERVEEVASFNETTGALHLRYPEDAPRRGTAALVYHYGERWDVPVASQVHLAQQLPYTIWLVEAFPGTADTERLTIQDVTREGSVLVEWCGEKRWLGPGANWSALLIDDGGGKPPELVTTAPERESRILAAFEAGARIYRLSLINYGRWPLSKVSVKGFPD